MRKFTAVLLGLALLMLAIAPATSLADPLDLPVKWSQLPDMDQGIDWLSTHQANGPIVVDDFQSDGRPILGFHWWGSYLDGYEPSPGWAQFEVSFHPDDPADPPVQPYSLPGQPYSFQFVTAQETYYGTTLGGEKVYEYWALLQEPWEETAGSIYWVDFGYDVAVNGYHAWGWHESDQHWNDWAVQTNPPSPGGNPHLGPWTVLVDHDMSFEVLTVVPEPATLAVLGVGLGLAGLLWRRKRSD